MPEFRAFPASLASKAHLEDRERSALYLRELHSTFVSWAGAIDWDHWFWSNATPEALTGCWLWHGPRWNTFGHGAAYFYGRAWGAHRLAFTIAHGPIPEGMSVLHRCDVPGCVNPEHLFVGTRADNVRDMAEKGRAARGTRCARAKLDPSSVGEVRRLRAELGLTTQAIAERFGVDRTSIGKILRGVTWRGAGPS